MQQGERKGRREGKHETATEIALKLLAEGSEVAFVQKITGLASSDIEVLKQQ